MRTLVAMAVLVVLLAALIFGAKARRQAPAGPVPPGPPAGVAPPAPTGETQAGKTSGGGIPEETGTPPDGTTGEIPGNGTLAPLPRAERQARTIRRMEAIARSWLEPFSLESAMTEGQAAEVLEIVKGFIAEYEALRWRRDVEEDVETTVERLYSRTEGLIRAKLGAGQKDAFRGLPRDWGFGKLDPGPLPEK
jgi:hypothetical protein